MSLLKSVLKWFGLLLALLIVLAIAAFGYNAYLIQVRSEEARHAAEAFCREHPAGTPVEKALADAAASHRNATPLAGADGYDIEFMYFLSGWGCRVRTDAGQITRTEIVSVR